MIPAKDYFEQYLAWKHTESNLRSATATYEPFSTMDLKTLTLEADAQSPAALEELGERYLFGLSELPVNADKAESLFRQAAAQGNPEAMNMLAEIHSTNEFGKLDYDRYFIALQQAAEHGSWKAMFNLACALYKGKDAYDGHGFEANRAAALQWSTRCAAATMDLLNFYFTNPCSDGFKDYMQGVFALFIQSVCVSARQLIRGDGVEKDLGTARSMLTDAQNFYQHYFNIECSDFTMLLKHCDEIK